MTSEHKEEYPYSKETCLEKARQLFEGKDKVYARFYGGCGSTYFIKKDGDKYSTLWMSQECWGQYGMDQLYEMKVFIEGYEDLTGVDTCINNLWGSLNMPKFESVLEYLN
jgi:hypothetical protein